tara:strand:- start:259 stop:1437 length:1179 start_codon:yes stop_codon:yes gene_type:complete
MGKSVFTSESVTEGHPDKVADQISDAILDALLIEDPTSRVACEALVTTGTAIVSGEISTSANVDISEIIRKTIVDIGYDDPSYGIDGNNCDVITYIDHQSPDIAMGVGVGGAGDQGMMFGYATNETPEYMPVPIQYAHHLTRRLAEVRREGILPWIRPDGKAQVSVVYEDGVPVSIDNIVVSTQHHPDIENEIIRDEIIQEVILHSIKSDLLDPDECEFHINPTGRFVIGGPHGDTGLTGRKIIVDTYGGIGAHGGGAFSGKDATKVDRSGAYLCRWIARNIVESGRATNCEIRIAYAIGIAQPVAINIDTKGSGKFDDHQMVEVLKGIFDFRPQAIIEQLNLIDPIFLPTASYGHFGRNPVSSKLKNGRTVNLFPWEESNKTSDILAAIDA